MRAAIQLYTLRDLDRPLPELLELVAEAGFDGVEFAGLDGTDPEEIAATLSKTGLSVAGAHVPIEDIAESVERTVEIYRTIGCDTLVVPLLDAEDFESGEAVAETAQRLDSLAHQLLAQDMRLCYHNHDFEFTPLDGDDGYDRVVAETTDLGFELDVGWANAAGRDPVALLERLSGRVPLVHLKDVDVESGEPTELGEGSLDLAACTRAACRAGAVWCVYERDDPDDPEASLSHGAEVLSSLL